MPFSNKVYFSQNDLKVFGLLINKTIKAHWEEKGELDDEVKIPRKLDNA